MRFDSDVMGYHGDLTNRNGNAMEHGTMIGIIMIFYGISFIEI